jgi:hypothetical protein
VIWRRAVWYKYTDVSAEQSAPIITVHLPKYTVSNPRKYLPSQWLLMPFPAPKVLPSLYISIEIWQKSLIIHLLRKAYRILRSVYSNSAITCSLFPANEKLSSVKHERNRWDKNILSHIIFQQGNIYYEYKGKPCNCIIWDLKEF